MSLVYMGKDENGDSIWVEKSQARQMIPKNDACFTLGCIGKQVDKFREDAKRHGYAVEFKEDKEVPGFYNADLTGMSAQQRDRYADHRNPREEGVANHSGGGVGVTSAEELERMKEWATKRWS